MEITFENILEKIVNNRSISRKEKQNAISKFLKENAGSKKNLQEHELKILEELKTIRKSYLAKDAQENKKNA